MLEFLLTVDFDQMLRQFPQSLQGHYLAIHIGARAAIRTDDAPYHEFAVEVDGLPLQPFDGGSRQVREARSHLGPLRALTRDIARAAAAGDQQQGIDHDGFTGAGLAREGGQAAAEFELGLIDEHQVPQLQMREHA